MTNNFIHQYLLGESFKNIFIRFIIILLSIIIIWCCLIIILIFYTRYQRKKQIQKLLESHHHAYDSQVNLTTKQLNELKQSFRYHSSSKPSSPIEKLFSPIKQEQFFAAIKTQTSMRQKFYEDNKLSLNFNGTHSIIKAMTKPPLISNPKKDDIQQHPKNLSDNKLNKQNQYLLNICDNTSIKQDKKYVRHSISTDNRDENFPIGKSSQKFSIKIRSYSNMNLNSSQLLTNTNQNRSFLHNLISKKRRYPLLNNASTDSDNYTRDLPTVMITDTNISFTNIVELETFEDKNRTISDMEKRLINQLRASRRPRYST
ncbi:unnamed protein product [Adineta steineri]|uniref:Uncharacterized protein n=1 Tax=Adineta steineri TaxID=433720 RepID=A0A818RKA3_9BILA|nr:unnamed protein product [Adineta steineri]